MILKGSTVRSVEHARKFSRHLLKRENEIVQVRESLSGPSNPQLLENDLVDLQLLTKLTNGKNGLFHVAISPREHEHMKDEEWERSMEIVAEEFDLTDQPRLVVYHQKDCRPHLHVLWSLVDLEKQKLILLNHYKRRLTRLADELEREFGHQKTSRKVSAKSFRISNAEP